MTPTPLRRAALLAAVAALAALALPGCSAPGAPAPPASPDPARGAHAASSTVANGTFAIARDAGAGACVPPVSRGTGSYERNVVHLALPPNATRLHLHVEWEPVNPTAARLNFTLWEAVRPGEQPFAAVASESPLDWEVPAGPWTRMPEVQLQAAATACDAPGAYASAVVDQPLRYRAEAST